MDGKRIKGEAPLVMARGRIYTSLHASRVTETFGRDRIRTSRGSNDRLQRRGDVDEMKEVEWDKMKWVQRTGGERGRGWREGGGGGSKEEEKARGPGYRGIDMEGNERKTT